MIRAIEVFFLLWISTIRDLHAMNLSIKTMYSVESAHVSPCNAQLTMPVFILFMFSSQLSRRAATLVQTPMSIITMCMKFSYSLTSSSFDTTVVHHAKLSATKDGAGTSYPSAHPTDPRFMRLTWGLNEIPPLLPPPLPALPAYSPNSGHVGFQG
jgi:hypothetical protein